MTVRLFEATKNALFKEKWIVPGGNHNNTFMMAGPDYVPRLRKFINKCLQLPIDISDTSEADNGIISGNSSAAEEIKSDGPTKRVLTETSKED